MKKYNTWMLAEASMMIALSIILSEFIKVFKMPMGGSITAGGMVPLFIFAYRWGGKYGMLIGAVYGVLDLLVGGIYSVHPISLLFDYPIAFGILGIAGFFKKTQLGLMLGVFTGIFGRFVCHTFSGVVVFASSAPAGQSPLLYSILYNGTYLLPEFVITVVLVFVIMRYVKLPLPKNA
jgi:thiamine transporter